MDEVSAANDLPSDIIVFHRGNQTTEAFGQDLQNLQDKQPTGH